MATAKSGRPIWAVSAIATFVVVAIVLATRRHAPEAIALRSPHPASSSMPAAFVALRDDTIARAKELKAPLDELAAAIATRDLAKARSSYAEARRRDRELQPLTRDLAGLASSQLGAWGIDPDEASPAIGMRAMGDALRAVPPRWEDAERNAATMARAAEVLPHELEVQEWTTVRVGKAISAGIFVAGARLDGSDAGDRDERMADVRAEIGGVLRATAAVRDATRAILDPSGDAIDRHLETLHAWLATQRDEPRDVLPILLETGELGADVRRAIHALTGETLPPPFPPLHPSDPVFPAVTVATFPRSRRPTRDPALVALGKALFESKLLSRNRNIGCASCHDERCAFSTAEPVLTFDRKIPPRNAPSLVNVGADVTFFWDGRASTLDAQIDVAVDRDMGGRWDEIVTRVSADATLAPMWRAVSIDAPSARAIRDAIEAFEESLVTSDTPFDRFVAGDRTALGTAEKRGFDLFFGRAGCSRCHRLPLTNGMVPPRFFRHELSSIGVPAHPKEKKLDPDLGRFGVTHLERDRGLFKVPQLRRIAETAPYFHNGAFATLDQVIDFYEKGGGVGLGLDVPNVDPDLRPFEIDGGERADLLAFLVRGLGAPTSAPSPTTSP